MPLPIYPWLGFQVKAVQVQAVSPSRVAAARGEVRDMMMQASSVYLLRKQEKRQHKHGGGWIREDNGGWTMEVGWWMLDVILAFMVAASCTMHKTIIETFTLAKQTGKQ